ncbi:hypothetical protein BJ508DRAFT_118065 [Ascobolus immersus RN42]|uniref:Uncharacterized protein n=1 Tax=Ascobolus immersus RN42 TaxID=1160509 RepID=A0A3N4IA39_ASCIM|nr:hypothetical protein BJ508DRAFT_118065 [Ascobolus immersus RN42]
MSLEPQLSSLCRETAGLFNSQIHGNHLLDSQLRYALEDAQTRFSIWIGNVGALAPGKAGIDYRLRDYEEMANILFSLLDRLKTKLEKVSDTSLAILEEDEMEKEEEDGDEREGQAAYGGVIGSTSNISEKHLTLDLSAFETSSTSGITSATSSLHSSSSKENGSSSYASSNEAYGAQWSDTVRAMNGIIDRLFRFATVLRNPTSTSEDARVRAFMAKHADTHLEDPDNEDFTNHTRWFIDLRLPKLPKELKDRLHNTMQFRRMMLLYRQRHQAKLKKTEVGLQKDHWSPAEKAPERTTLDLESMVDIFDHGSSSEVASLNTLVTALDVLSAPQPSAEQRRPAVKVPGQSVVLSDTIASSVNKRKLPRYQKSIMSKVSAITRTGEERRRQLGVPAAPEEQSAIALHFECPYCFQLINKDERIEPRWSYVKLAGWSLPS